MTHSKAIEAARSAAWGCRENGNIEFDRAIDAAISAYLSALLPVETGELAEWEKLAEGVPPAGWAAFYKNKYDELHVSLPMTGSSMKLALAADGIAALKTAFDADDETARRARSSGAAALAGRAE